MVDWVSLVVPFAYLGVLIGSLATFSHLYRARKASKAASLAPWFGPHFGRNIYLSLLHMEPAEGPKVPDSVLKAALMRRAVEDIHRLVEVRNSKQALQSLLQRGSVGDDLWQRFQRAEKEIEAELRDVVQEANAFSPGWGQTIFQSASEIAQNQLLQQRVAEIQAQASTEKAWWEKKRASIQADFMKELDGAQTKNSDDDAVLVEGGGPAATGAPQQQQQRPKSRGKKKK